MSDLAVRAEGLGKQFRRGTTPYKTLRESLSALVRTSTGWGGQRDDSSSASEVFWALRDASFEIKHGEVVGIIGRNGAGKSTLLKVLSRITTPTSGRAEIHGRVGSLLEVGTGFHPELSGRENVFMNGAILGMRRAEIISKFDEIVAFAEVEQFVDTPVKHYSSGMYLRLAFAVAAHLEPEILIVDEVLAVGDAAFQRKCLHKMEEVGHRGRTVLFVSHNMPAVTRLCPRTILLDGGRIHLDAPSSEVISAYLRSGLGTNAVREWPDLATAPGNEIVRLRAVRVLNANREPTEVQDIRKPIGLQMEYEVLQGGARFVPNFLVYNEDGVFLFVVSDTTEEARSNPREVGRFVTTGWLPGNFMAEGTFIVTAAITTFVPVTLHVNERDVTVFQVVDAQQKDAVRGGEYTGPIGGVVRPMIHWESTQDGKPMPATPPLVSEGSLPLPIHV